MLVSRGVSPDLDALKAALARMPDVLTSAIVTEMERVPAFTRRNLAEQFWQIEYMPKAGYAIVTQGGPCKPQVLAHLPDWELLFQTHDAAGKPCCYYRSALTAALDDEYGDIISRIRDHENAVLIELCQVLRRFKPDMVRASQAIAQLDCLVSFGELGARWF